MLGDILWTILGLIGLAVVITIVWAFWVTYKIKKRMRALMKSFYPEPAEWVDHHPANPARKDVTTIASETVKKEN